MRRRGHPELTLLLLVAPLLACHREPEDRHCIDASGNYVDDWRCDPAPATQAPGPAVGGYGYGYHWIYVPRTYYSGPGTAAGAFRGATSPGSGHAVVSRGGFGGTAAGHAGS